MGREREREKGGEKEGVRFTADEVTGLLLFFIFAFFFYIYLTIFAFETEASEVSG